MSTVVYMVRHGESPKEGNERTRGLTAKGYLDAQRVSNILEDEKIDVVVSSPYKRAILTVEKIAQQLEKGVIVFEDLKERIFSTDNQRLADMELVQILEKSYFDSNFSIAGAESNADCQNRALKVLKELLDTFRNKKIVIGTHGAIMTLMMGYFDSTYDLNFLHSTSKPDIYRMEFNGQDLLSVQRIWDVDISDNK